MKLLLITLALLLAFTSAMRIMQDDSCQTYEYTYESYGGGTCTTQSEWCPDHDTWNEECPGKRVASR